MHYDRAQKYPTRRAAMEKLAELMDEYKNIIVLDADTAESTYTSIIRNKYKNENPKRFYDFGVAEQNMIAAAVGLASEGMIPVVNAFAVFLSNRCADQIRQGLIGDYHIIFRSSHRGFVGKDGPSHHAINDITIMSSIPGMYAVIEPCDAIETKRAMEWAVERNKKAVYIGTHRDAMPLFMPDDYEFELCKGYEIDQKYNTDEADIAIFASGPYMIKNCLEAKKALEPETKARLINMATIKPMKEEEIMKYIGSKTKVVTAECASVRGGLGNAVGMVLGEYGIPHRAIGIADDYYGFSDDVGVLLKDAGLDSESIAKKTIDFYRKITK